MTENYKKDLLATCDELGQKLALAGYRLDCGRCRTLINIGYKEHQVLTLALRYFKDKVENAKEVTP